MSTTASGPVSGAVVSEHPRTERIAIMSPTRRTLSACLLMIITVSTGCSDHVTPTAPVATHASVALSVAAAKPRPSRVPYISSLQLSTAYIPTSPSDEITPFTVTVTNPGAKDVQGISLEGELQPTLNNQSPLATSFVASCPNATGVVPRGDCTMSNWISSGALLSPGPGTFTLRLLQRQPDGTKKVLDSKTVDVVFVEGI
jgi:hypothetical protein